MERLKRIVKRLLKIKPLEFSDEKNVKPSPFLERFRREHPKIADDKLPLRQDHEPYYDPIRIMQPFYDFFNSELYEKHPEVKPVFEYDNFHSGTPMKSRPFPGALRAVRQVLRRNNLYWYPRSSGGYKAQQQVVDYLKREGFPVRKTATFGGIGVNNVVFSCSTTHAYSLILSVMARPNDVILMTAPNYGLFAIMAELDNYRTELLPLSKDDGWQVNPEKLAERIDELNRELKKENPENPARVAVFLNLNPHNPLGKVLSAKNRKTLDKISEVCYNKGIGVIDDLVYRDLTYDLDHLALPMAANPHYFSNTVSLFGLSKAYGLASFRAAVIVAPDLIAKALTERIHDTMDSMPVLQVAATASCFNGSNCRYRNYCRYMGRLNREYQFRYHLLKALVYGLEKEKDSKMRRKIIRVIFRYAGKDYNELKTGVSRLRFYPGTEPESGFFVVMDFTAFKGSKYTKNHKTKTIRTEMDLLEYIFMETGLTYLMGGNICWPNPDEFVGRVSFGISRKALVLNMRKMKRALSKLELKNEN